MNDAELSYWSALTQIYPVLGLALVLELRVIGDARRAKGAELSTGLVVVGSLAGLAMVIALFVGLDALRENQAPPEWVATFCSIAVLGGVGFVVSNPVIYLMTSRGSRIFSLVVTFSPRTTRQVWRIRRGARQLNKLATKRRIRAFETLTLIRETRGLLEEKLALLEHLPRPHTEAVNLMYEGTVRRQKEVVVDEAEFAGLWRRAILHEINVRKYGRWEQEEIDEMLRSFQTSERRVAHEFFRSLDSTGVFHAKATTDWREAEPDDGGFLPPRERPRINNYRYGELPFVALSIEDFARESESD